MSPPVESMTGIRATLAIFGKQPLAGMVKTRLAEGVGAEAAARLAAAFFDDALSLGAQATVDRRVVAWSGDAPPERVPPDFELWDQGDGDLGDRMERVLRRALEEAELALIVGSDLPGLPAHHVDDAVRLLEEADAVLGPSDDGGFYLVGLRHCPRGVFAGVPWSSVDTFGRTVDRLRSLDLRVAFSAPWFDVDRPEDLARVRRGIDAGELHAPATARVLASLLPR